MKHEWVRITGANAHILRPGNHTREIFGSSKLDTVVTSVPERREAHDGAEQWSWTAVAYDGQSVSYLITRGWEHYGPEVYLRRDVEEEPEQKETFTDAKKPVTMAK